MADARNLEQFADNYFDFILFSFNDIDYISHADRFLVLGGDSVVVMAA
ncbi:hypothetical protein BGM30_05580 [Microcystis aeruginosa NIES-298]|uniref:Uncharacterized protein n=1 Tax=Microcystis aeruginosa NIES-298 TaxID=449468 RepID=A0A9P2YGE8_MICAE|nr:hypothetical protein BGM30_05580 [Microcystis aeruginosa NIES-298]